MTETAPPAALTRKLFTHTLRRHEQWHYLSARSIPCCASHPNWGLGERWCPAGEGGSAVGTHGQAPAASKRLRHASSCWWQGWSPVPITRAPETHALLRPNTSLATFFCQRIRQLLTNHWVIGTMTLNVVRKQHNTMNKGGVSKYSGDRGEEGLERDPRRLADFVGGCKSARKNLGWEKFGANC